MYFEPLNLENPQVATRCMQATHAFNFLWKSKIKAKSTESLCHYMNISQRKEILTAFISLTYKWVSLEENILVTVFNAELV